MEHEIEQQKLPNVTTSLILGILSYICCCFSSGVLGVILSGIALLILRKDRRIYMANPEGYSNWGSYKTARLIAIIGLILSTLTLAWTVYTIQSMGGWEAYMEMVQEMMEEFGVEAE